MNEETQIQELGRALGAVLGLDIKLADSALDWRADSLARLVLGRRSTLWRDEREYMAALKVETDTIRRLLDSGHTMGALFDKVGTADSPKTLKTLAGVR
jgi:hypothetical protein